jgi:hypothetical protein
MKRILGLTIAFILCIGMVGTGSWSYFTDPELSEENVMIAGSLDLRTDNVNGVTQTLYATGMKPGDIVGPSVIQLKNAGSTDGPTLDIAFSYVESDGSPNEVNVSANATAAMMEVVTLNYDSASLLGSVADNNSNGCKDVQDLVNADLSSQSGLAPDATKPFEIELKISDDLDNDFQGDGINVGITFILNQ